MAPKGKTAAKAAPAPAPVEEVGALAEGTYVRFLGYGADVPENEQLLEAEGVYTIAGFTPPDDEFPNGNPFVQIENPDFDPKKKEHPEKNPKMIDVEVFEEEIEVLTEEEVAELEAAEAAADAEAADAEAAAAAPAPAGKAKAAAKTAAKTEAAAPAAAKGKAKAAAEPAAAKGKAAAPAKAKGKVAQEPANDDAGGDGDGDDMPDLENEDPGVVEILESGQNLIEAAQGLETDTGRSEYRLGGILFHIQKGKTYLEVDGGQEYAEKGGFAKFLKEYFNIDYRKAMYLIEIYRQFTIAGIEDAAEVVAQMGWTKAQKIAPMLTVEGNEPSELIELANTSSVDDLSSAIKEQKTIGGKNENGEKVTRVTLRLRLIEQEGADVQATLEAIAETNGLKDIGEALVWLCDNFNQQQGGDAAVEAAPAQGKAKAAPKAAAAAKTPAKRGAVKAG